MVTRLDKINLIAKANDRGVQCKKISTFISSPRISRASIDESRSLHAKNGFAKRSKILAGYRLGK